MGKSGVPSNLVAYPSLSSSLNALPQATSMSNVQLHAGIYGQRVSASEAKLQKAISKTASTYGSQKPPTAQYTIPPSPQSPDTLMMRKPQKSK